MQGVSVCAEDVYVSYKAKPALRGVTFAVKEGEIFGFLGPSGAGKTTTIKLLTSQLRADSGTVRIFGKDVMSIDREAFDKVGVLSDSSGLYERLNVYENMALFADLLKTPRKYVKVLLERIGLGEEMYKPAKQLSRGMKQRLMLARTILHQPKLLFLDEPTASLDPANTQQIHALLRELNRQGTTIFLTTHNMMEAEVMCERVAFLSGGVVAVCDTPETLRLSHSRNEIVLKTSGGVTRIVPKGVRELQSVLNGLAEDDILSIHSVEPNLEEVFLMVTGSALK
jgi:ABC-2 type transport system ATP-binding protein